MKLLYVGDADNIAKSLVDNFVKEGDTVFIVSNNDFKKSQKPALKYKFFAISSDYQINDEIFLSINPDAIIFAGKDFLRDTWDYKNGMDNYLSQLSYWLEKSELVKKFIYLSTTQVYGNNGQAVNEESPIKPKTLKGLTIANGEFKVKLYERQFEIKTTILRCSDVFDYNINVEHNDFLSGAFEKVIQNTVLNISNQDFFQPIHVNDIVNAIKCILQNGLKNKTYNLCSSIPIKKSEIYSILIQKNNKKCDINSLIEGISLTIDNDSIKKDLEWTDFKDFKTFIMEHDFSQYLIENELSEEFNYKSRSNKKHKLFKKLSDFSRKIIEHIFILLVFCGVSFFTKDNSLFSSIDWMIIYIIIISLSYGIYHATLAVAFSSIIHLYNQNFDFMEIINFYSYVDVILKIIEYILVGVFISYIIDMLKEKVRVKTEENNRLITEKNEIRVINNKNVLIKNEYEKRLLSTKNSLPKLYSVISKINVLQPEKIFYEILNVISDMMDTSTVAVYITNKSSSYIRLTAALNDESIYRGKSWDLKNDLDIKELISNGEIYCGRLWDEKPAFVAPIMHGNNCIAVIVIKKMLFENQSLYQVNLLRTLTILISDAVSKAMDYEKSMEINNYIEGTEILLHNEFIKKVSLGYEKQKLNLGNCCVIRCNVLSSDLKSYKLIKDMLRNTDIIGLNNKNEICILLGNDSKRDGEFLIERLDKCNIIAEVTDDFEYLGE